VGGILNGLDTRARVGYITTRAHVGPEPIVLAFALPLGEVFVVAADLSPTPAPLVLFSSPRRGVSPVLSAPLEFGDGVLFFRVELAFCSAVPSCNTPDGTWLSSSASSSTFWLVGAAGCACGAGSLA
jgi:hypothetical protein